MQHFSPDAQRGPNPTVKPSLYLEESCCGAPLEKKLNCTRILDIPIEGPLDLPPFTLKYNERGDIEPPGPGAEIASPLHPGLFLRTVVVKDSLPPVITLSLDQDDWAGIQVEGKKVFIDCASYEARTFAPPGPGKKIKDLSQASLDQGTSLSSFYSSFYQLQSEVLDLKTQVTSLQAQVFALLSGGTTPVPESFAGPPSAPFAPSGPPSAPFAPSGPPSSAHFTVGSDQFLALI